MDGKFMDSVASPSDSLEGAHAHAINARPSFLPRGVGSLIHTIDTITSGTELEAEVRNCIGPAVTMRVAVESWKGIFVWSYLRA